jgi:pimeloyl-ACP methyl ester carboxylesterase
VATVRASTGSPYVHLVGHSLGGLVARYAVQQLCLHRVTRSVLTVGTPHRGTVLAHLGAGPAMAQLRPHSVLLRQLPPLHRTHQVKWTVVHGSADRVVRPLRADGELSVPGYGHHDVLCSPQLADILLEHLTAAERAPGAGLLTTVAA